MTKRAKKHGNSLYKNTYPAKLIKFFDRNPAKTEMQTKIIDGKEVVMPVEVACDVPFLTDFAKSIGVSYWCVNNWANKYEEFANALKVAKELQKNIIIQNALHGRYHASFSIFTLKNIAGWRDSRDINHSGNITHVNFFENIVKKAQEVETRIPQENFN